MKVAMKAKDKPKLAAVRMIKSALEASMKEQGLDELADAEAVAVLRKLAKMRQESVDMYTTAGETERAASEQAELDVISIWLPQLAGEEQTRAWIAEAIAEAGGDNKGKVMGALMKAHKDDIDGKLANKLVAEMLEG